MRRILQIGLLIVVLGMVSATHAAELSVRDAVEAGAFFQQIAQSMNLHVEDGADAASALRRAGYDVPVFPSNHRMTEGEVASVLSSLQVPVTTSRPQAPFSASKLSSLLAALGPEFGDRNAPNSKGDAVPIGGADPRTKGKGKKKGLLKSPSGL
jgi:hypothetical protein